MAEKAEQPVKLQIDKGIQEIAEQELLALQTIADTYLQESLHMNPKIKTCQISDLASLKKRIG